MKGSWKMKTVCLLSLLLLTTSATAEEASEADVQRRKECSAEASRLEAKRNALKDSIRSRLRTAETLNAVADLMEGKRQSSPVEDERLSVVRTFETDVPKSIVKSKEDKATCVHRWMTLDEGRRYRFTAEVRAEDVKGVNVKFGLMVPQRSGKTLWPSASVGTGSFDWRTVSFDFEIPSGAGNVLLLYGLEGGTGKVEFRNVTVCEVSQVLKDDD